MKRKFALSFVVLVFAVAALVLLPGRGGDSEGDLIVHVFDANAVLVIEEMYAFEADDTLYTVLNRHHDVRVSGAKSDAYGRALLGIDDVQTDFKSTFIYIEVDGVEARHGIDQLPLFNGTTYTFTVRNVD